MIMARNARYDRKTALDRAVQLFWKRGYYATSMKQIEEALDMRPGSIYAMFGSKDRLFSEALQLYALQSQEMFDEEFTQQESVLTGLQNYLRRIVEACTPDSATPARTCMMVKTLLETSNTHSSISSQVNVLLQNVENSMASILQRAKETGELIANTDTERLARLLQAQIIGLRSFAQREITAQQVTDLANDIIATLEPYRIPTGKKSRI